MSEETMHRVLRVVLVVIICALAIGSLSMLGITVINLANAKPNDATKSGSAKTRKVGPPEGLVGDR